MSVSGVLVTRGDQPTAKILASWPFPDKVVWNNAEKPADLKVYGRWAALSLCQHETVFVQDDDCLVPVQALLARYEGTMLLNIPPGEKPLVGWGAVVVKKPCMDAIGRYLASHPLDDEFLRCADVVVTSLVPWERIDLGHDDLPWADTPERMFRAEGHYEERERVYAKCLSLASA